MHKALQLSLFGAVDITLHGESIIPPITGKPLALLIYLAVTRAVHSRNALATLLWADLDDHAARNNLRYLLPNLRRVVGDYLLITPRTVAFDLSQSTWCDVTTVRQTLALPAARVATADLQATLDLYHGEFLAGFRVRNAPYFEEWLTLQREELQRLAVQGLYTLAQRYLVENHLTAGLAMTQRLLTLEPWHEAGHRLQMQLLATSGQRGTAIAQYHQWRHRLIDDLGLDPTAETQELYAQLIAGELGEDVSQPPVPTLPHMAPATTLLLPTAHTLPGFITNTAVILPPKDNLPGQLTPFIGRWVEITELRHILLASDSRLVTLVGEGGVGKTRLALAVAQSLVEVRPQVASPNDPTAAIGGPASASAGTLKFLDGVWFVPLAGMTTAGDLMDQLAAVVAQAIGLPFSGKQALLAQLLIDLRNKALLLLFDNVEHLLPTFTDFLIQLLQGAPCITVLITSRHILNLQAELVWRLTGLPLPLPEEMVSLPLAGISDYSSITLFVERAGRINRGFRLSTANQATIVAICRLVEGLPLAIELAAALTKRYTCDELYAALKRDYTILSTTLADLSPRHRSIEAMLAYSWRFLTPAEAHVMAACAIFAGAFAQDAATAVTGATPTILASLADQSLLQAATGRFGLHELIRHYAAGQLAQSPADQQQALARHAAYYMSRLHGLEAALLDSVDAQVALQSELDNVRAAWRWCAEQGKVDLLAVGLTSLQCFYRLAGLYREAIHLLEMALTGVRLATTALVPGAAQPLLARLLCDTAQFYRRIGGVETGETLAAEALVLGQQLADPALQALAYHELARLAQVRSDFLTMYRWAEQGCIQARQAALPHLTAECLNDLGIAVSSCMHPLTAIPHFHEALRYLQNTPNRYLEARVLGNLGFFHLSCHEYQAACLYLPQAQIWQRQLQDRESSMITQILLGDLWMALGAYAAAKQEYEQVLTMMQTIHNPYWKSWLHASYGHLQYLCGDPMAAYMACTRAREIAQQGKSHVQEQWILIDLGHALSALGDWDAARHCYQQAIALKAAGDWTYRIADAHAGLAALFFAQNEQTTALAQIEVALEIIAQQGLAAAKEPFVIYWTAVRILHKQHDPRAVAVLKRASQTLQGIANQLENEALRRSFLDEVIVNRSLLRL